MILTVTELYVKPGAASEFESRFRAASRLLGRAAGCLGCELHKGVEQDNRYLAFVRWQSIHHHLAGFRRSPAYEAWTAELAPCLDRPPEAGHYVEIRLSLREDGSSRRNEADKQEETDENRRFDDADRGGDAGLSGRPRGAD